MRNNEQQRGMADSRVPRDVQTTLFSERIAEVIGVSLIALLIVWLVI